jgi:hypothetical protein
MNRINKLALTAIAAALILPQSAAAQDAADAAAIGPRFEYAVKVVCGRVGTPNGPLSLGSYFTAVNIHNPNEGFVPFRRKVALALPGNANGPVTGFITLSLKSDGAVEIDCVHIRKQLGLGIPLIKGFLVIQSVRELDVVAVYTAAPGPANQVSSIHTERVPPRKM